MKNVSLIFVTLALTLAAGCSGLAQKPKGELLSVDFEKDQTLRYRFISKRNITLEWGSAAGSKRPDKSTETLTMIMAYTPVNVERYGTTTIKATCENVTVVTGGSRGGKQDAALSLKGKSYTFKVGPTGRIEDYSEFTKVLQEAGKKAMRTSSKQGMIKDPDMLGDVIGTQYFLWDSISSIDSYLEGLEPNDTWQSTMSIPNPMVLRLVRNVDYTLTEIQETEQGKVAVIDSTYTYAPSGPKNWPVPYTQRFQVAGRFGTLRNYKVNEFSGSGRELYDIDNGRTIKHDQQFNMKLGAIFLLPLPGLNPSITIDHSISMELLEK